LVRAGGRIASNREHRAGLLTAGGILSIIVGVFELIVGGIALDFAVFGVPPGLVRYFQAFGVLPLYGWGIVSLLPVIFGGVLVVVGVVAIGGGVSAIRRESYGLSLAGAICALPAPILGILAVIFVALGNEVFGAKVHEG
jgi:hypothetical protein